MYFLNRRPRGFHYTYRFTSERRDIIARLRRGDAPSDVAADTLRTDTVGGICRHGSCRTSGMLLYAIVLIALLLGVLAAVMALMLA